MGAAHDKLYTASELAAALGTTARALRFYESKGLLAPRRAGTRRVYDYRDRARLQLILRGKRLGFSLAQIKEYLALYQVDTGRRGQLAHLKRLVAERIADLEQRRRAINETLRELREIGEQVDAALASPGTAAAPCRRATRYPEEQR